MIASKRVQGRASRTGFGLKLLFPGSPENCQALIHSMNLTMKILKLTTYFRQGYLVSEVIGGQCTRIRRRHQHLQMIQSLQMSSLTSRWKNGSIQRKWELLFDPVKNIEEVVMWIKNHTQTTSVDRRFIQKWQPYTSRSHIFLKSEFQAECHSFTECWPRSCIQVINIASIAAYSKHNFCCMHEQYVWHLRWKLIKVLK